MRNVLRNAALAFAVACCCVAVASAASIADRNAREGCMDQWLFNGVWRVRVTAVEPYSNGGPQIGWEVTEVWRNGTYKELSPTNSQITGQTLELDHGTIPAGSLALQEVSMNNFPPAGEFTYKQVFVANGPLDPSDKPKGVLVTFDNASLSTQKQWPQFTSGKYDFHFNLDCTATGANAQAEGGSTQVAAVPGCVNQWLSNGIWKMRINAIGTVPAVLQKPEDQIGWSVAQTWVNVSGRGIRADNLPDMGGKYVGTNATDEFIVTQNGKTSSSANVNFGYQLRQKPPRQDWDPGESWTFTQTFGWGSLDPTDKPIRLLAVFDDQTQNATPGVPHYRKPADFRIDLTCTK